MTVHTPPHHRVAIIGTGFGGLGMAVRLKQRGVEDFVLLERATDVGGVWRDNRYPGCACDVQSHLYSFSFAPNPEWSRAYSPQGEIEGYLRGVADRFGLRRHCRFDHEVSRAVWDDPDQRWRIETSKGTFTADVLVSGAGALSEPSVPALPGLNTFEGVVMHSARWDGGQSWAGKRVAVIGTGASAIQFVPHLQRAAARLFLFQRTPPWVLPRNDHPIPAWKRWLYRAVPALHGLRRLTLHLTRELLALGFLYPWLLARAQKFALQHLERSVPDPALRARLTPDYTMGCKRILLSDDYLPAVSAPNVELVTEGIQTLRARSVVTADGAEREVDTVVLGTGFQITDMPIARRVHGRDGRTLSEHWAGSPKAHLGTTHAGFPNFFMLQGPNTGLGHTSVILMIESQIEHVLGALRHLEARGLAAVEPSPEAQARFVAEVDARMTSTVWMQGGCRSWYLDSTGRNSALWPGFTIGFKRRVARFDPAEYVAIARRDVTTGTEARKAVAHG